MDQFELIFNIRWKWGNLWHWNGKAYWCFVPRAHYGYIWSFSRNNKNQCAQTIKADQARLFTTKYTRPPAHIHRRSPILIVTLYAALKNCRLNRDFAYTREIIQKASTLDSGKFVDFIQTFGTLISFSYNLVLILWIFNKVLKLLFFPGKIVTSLGNNFSMQKSLFKKFLDVKFLFVNRFSKFLRHILELKQY